MAALQKGQGAASAFNGPEQHGLLSAFQGAPDLSDPGWTGGSLGPSLSSLLLTHLI